MNERTPVYLSKLFGELRSEFPAEFPQAKVPPVGGHNCPWLISDRAAQDVWRLLHSKSMPDALAELRGYILDIVERKKEPRVLASGYQQYRSASPLRCRIIVNPASDPPEVVEVRPDHERRAGPYERGSKGRPW